jgi:hypothetical protein
MTLLENLMTVSLSAFPKGAKYFEQTVDGSGNPLTITYYSGSDNTTPSVRKIAFTYDGSGNLLTGTILQD